MMQRVLNVMDKNFMKVDFLNGVRRIQDVFYERNTECFVVYDDEKLAGVVTKKELVRAHPNRIIADVMSDKYICIDYCTYIWEIREIFNLNRDIDIALVRDDNKVIGYITRTTLNAELGKYIDLLTGLHKNDYLFYNAYKLMKSEQNTTIIFIDLNNFGYIDKKYGHINGDAILKDVAEVLKGSISSECYLCRYAGDEFAILTPHPIDDSMVLAEKIINAISSYDFTNNIPVSASIGITSCRIHNNKIENIFEVIKKLVNVASLASAKAKQSANNSIIIGDVDIDAIA
ncbi:diguanylate cyclase [Clostridium peptidivorans]|uniref:diguanylate cyclase n=1 Tax=Clostridium peptidivorans TaxID=100174 RepID=UPI000BE223ED|nr:GGDEF domain-containing protein [Clostridium peptidivorans]